MGNVEIVRELNELRRGRGLEANDLDRHIGMNLRAFAEISDADAPGVVRRKLLLLMSQTCTQLPDDLRLAAQVGLALDERAQGEFLDKRIEWLATYLQRDPRTARRRMDQAFSLLAEYLSGKQVEGPNNPYAPEGWYVESIDALLRLDLNPPQLTEVRQIVATVKELDEIVVLLSAPQAGQRDARHRLNAEMVFGGEIVEERREAGGHLHLIVRLPRPLALGERHTYSVQFISYPRQHMQPYYVMNPYRRCDRFTLRARFPTEPEPTAIWRLNGAPPHVVADLQANDDPLTLDSVGEVCLEFHQLKQGLCYGLQWTTR